MYSALNNRIPLASIETEMCSRAEKRIQNLAGPRNQDRRTPLTTLALLNPDIF